jgi:hypothetical protein
MMLSGTLSGSWARIFNSMSPLELSELWQPRPLILMVVSGLVMGGMVTENFDPTGSSTNCSPPQISVHIDTGQSVIKSELDFVQTGSGFSLKNTTKSSCCGPNFS